MREEAIIQAITVNLAQEALDDLKLYHGEVEEALSKNYLKYNAVMGVYQAGGNSESLKAFISAMKAHHIHSFMGSTFQVYQLEKPVLVYRTGSMGKFWTSTPPVSPWQHHLENAMHPSFYQGNHAANGNVLVYEIPAGEIVAKGVCAPQGYCPGMGVQYLVQSVNASHVTSYSWQQWQNRYKPTLRSATRVTLVNKQTVQLRKVIPEKDWITIDIRSSSEKIRNLVQRFRVNGQALRVPANAIRYADALMTTGNPIDALGYVVGASFAIKSASIILHMSVGLPYLLVVAPGFLPDIKEALDENIAEIEHVNHHLSLSRKLMQGESLMRRLDEPSFNEKPQAGEYPFGIDEGLFDDEFPAAQKALLMFEKKSLETGLEAYPWQKVGQSLLAMSKAVGKVGASVVSILNPFSTPSLHAPEVMKAMHPGMLFDVYMNQMQCAERMNLDAVRQAQLNVITSLVMNHAPEMGAVQPIEVPPLPPRMLLTQDMSAPGYQGPQFKLHDHSKIPGWVKQGLTITAGGGLWQASLTLPLGYAPVAIGAVILVPLHFLSRREQHKIQIRNRNSSRVNKQCQSIKASVESIQTKITEVNVLCQHYLDETNPTKKQTLYVQCQQRLVEIRGVNESEKTLNDARINDDATKVEGHKVRHRTRAFCRTLTPMLEENGQRLDELAGTINEHATAFEGYQQKINEREQAIEKQRLAEEQALIAYQQRKCVENAARFVRAGLSLMSDVMDARVPSVIPVTAQQGVIPIQQTLWGQLTLTEAQGASSGLKKVKPVPVDQIKTSVPTSRVVKPF